jgi:hypothetical protein
MPDLIPDASHRVAVIAIHGVGYHESGASAEAVTDLLEGVLEDPKNPASPHRYGSFAPQEVQITLPRPIHEGKVQRKWENPFYAMEERRGKLAEQSKLKTWFSPVARAAAAIPDAATEFMDTLLKQFSGDPDHNSYTTWRRIGRRAATPHTPAVDVDVYDMHWADLARPTNSALRFIFSFYQLLLHLASLGRTAIDYAANENAGKLDWLLYSRSYLYATRVLTLFIVQLTVLIFGVAASPLPLLLDPASSGRGVASLVIALAAVTGVLLLAQFIKSRNWWFALIPALALGGITWWCLCNKPNLTGAILFAEWWLLGAGVCFYIFLKYDAVRAGSLEYGVIWIGVITLALLLLVGSQNSLQPVVLRTAAFYLVQYTFLALRFLWMLFFLLVVFSFLMERICRLRLKGQSEPLARARAASRTGRFAVAVPSVLILLLATFSGGMAYDVLSRSVTLYKDVNAANKPPFLPAKFTLNADQTESLLIAIGDPPEKELPARENPNRFLEGLLVQSPPLGIAASAGIAAVGILMLALIALPSVWYELFPKRSAANLRSCCLGNWLSGGYRNFRWIITLLWLSAFAIPVGIFAYGLLTFRPSGSSDSFLLYLYTHFGMPQAAKLLLHSGGILVGSGAVLLGLLVKKLSPVLDAVLDVDTYLRTSPVDATPRARIIERYVALLGHIHARRNPDNTHYYDRVIIVAHSLGSNITADMLRFFNMCAHPIPNGIDVRPYRDYLRFAFAGQPQGTLPLYFFTMGSPLRQLLDRFFPNLYQWICSVPEDSGPSPETMRPGDAIAPHSPPLPDELRLTQWANFYRSGDYIGRALWTHGVLERNPNGPHAGTYPEDLSKNECIPGPHQKATQIDACIGLGAHTHYWDRTAPDVGNQLDTMIAD